MDKKGFLNLFKNDDEQIIVKLWEDIELAQSIDYFIETDIFYPPNIWSVLEKININGMRFLVSGLNETSEKKNIIIIPKDFQGENPEFQLIFFKIDGTNRFKELLHKDFLGTIMSLGIKREIMGDLIVKNNICFGVIADEKYDIISKEINKIGNVPVKIKQILQEEVPESEFKTEIFLLSSLRLDSFVSSATGLSRQKSVEEIEKGNVLLNYNLEKDKSAEIKEGDILTVKKYGKFKFLNIKGESRKNKIRIDVKKFI